MIDVIDIIDKIFFNRLNRTRYNL